MDVDFGILELLASKICHDLVSPVGAINNGIELIEDVGGGVTTDAMKLVASSAAFANQRLKLFRLLYGRGGSDPGLKLDEARAVILAAIPSTKITIDWPQTLWPSLWLQRKGAFKLALNLICLAEECLPQGGTISLTVPMAACFAIRAQGRNASLLPENLEALGPKSRPDSITPRTIQAYFTGRLADYYGFEIKTDLMEKDGSEGVEFRLSTS